MVHISGNGITTESEVKVKETSAFNQYLVTCIVNVSSIGFGLTIGWLSPIIYLLRSDSTPLDSKITTEEMSWIGSIHLLTAMIGTVFFAYLSNRLGSRWAMCLCNVPLLIFWIIIMFADNVTIILVSRLFMGLGAGGFYSTFYVYIAEIAEDRIRGKLVSSVTLCCYFGCLLGYIICPLLPYHVITYVLMTANLIGLITGVIVLRNSPIYEMKKGRLYQASATLRWLRGVNRTHNVKNDEIDAVLEKLKASCHIEAPRVTYKDFISRVTLRGFFLGTMILIIQQASTVISLMNFAGTIFEDSGSSVSPSDATIISGSLLFIGSLCSSSLVERAGRRILLISSSVVVALSLLTLGTYSYIRILDIDVTSFAWIPVASLSVCFFSFSCGLGPLPLVVVSEIFLPKIRGLATSICVFSFWIFTFLITRFFNTIQAELGMHGCFWLFGCVMILGAAFIYTFLPETKGRSVEDIIRDLAGGRKMQHVNV